MQAIHKGRAAAAALGCKVNQYEAQMILEKFRAAGYDVSGEGDRADVFIINTCSVTNLSDRKSRQLIRRVIRNNPDCVVVATGCYAQVNPEDVSSIEGVDIVVGTNNKSRIVQITEDYIASGRQEQVKDVLQYAQISEYEDCGIIEGMESRTRALIKIQEGCDRFCSYCIIPFARGRARSRSLRDIVVEAKGLVLKGYREIVLAGINTALYGMEKGYSCDYEGMEKKAEGVQIYGVEHVVKAIDSIHGDFRIRLSSLEPTVVNKDYALSLMKYKKLCPHMHLSLQSGSDRILQLMNRHYSREEYKQIVDSLKSYDAGFGISTDIIVGFPGETEYDFNQTVELVKELGFCKVHVFPYSERSGTAACNLPDKVDEKTKKRRCDELSAISLKTEIEFLESCIGQTRRVLVEEFDETTSFCRGYTDNYIKIMCIGSESLKNSFINVKLESVMTEHTDIMRGTVV